MCRPPPSSPTDSESRVYATFPKTEISVAVAVAVAVGVVVGIGVAVAVGGVGVAVAVGVVVVVVVWGWIAGAVVVAVGGLSRCLVLLPTPMSSSAFGRCRAEMRSATILAWSTCDP